MEDNYLEELHNQFLDDEYQSRERINGEPLAKIDLEQLIKNIFGI